MPGIKDVVWVNDKDLGDLGFVLNNDLSGWRDTPTFRDRYSNLPGRMGAVSLSRELETEPRRMTLAGLLHATSVANLLANKDELHARLAEGTIEVRFSDDEERVYYGKLDGAVRISSIRPALVQKGHACQFTILCPDPHIYHRRTTVVPFAAAAAQVPLGTGVSTPILRIGTAPGGAATDPTITYKDHRGDTITSLVLSYTFGASEWLDIDSELEKITDESDANQISAISSGDFPRFDPHDAAGEDGPYPTIEISAATGAIDFAEAHYRKAWI